MRQEDQAVLLALAGAAVALFLWLRQPARENWTPPHIALREAQAKAKAAAEAKARAEAEQAAKTARAKLEAQIASQAAAARAELEAAKAAAAPTASTENKYQLAMLGLLQAMPNMRREEAEAVALAISKAPPALVEALRQDQQQALARIKQYLLTAKK